MAPRALLVVLLLGACAAPAAAWTRTRVAGNGQNRLAWYDRTITWHLPAPGSADVAHEVAVAAAKRAFAAWAAVGCTDVNFAFVTGGPGVTSLDGGEADGINTINWREADWPGAPDQIAITTVTYAPESGRILDVDIDLNGQYLFFTASDDPNQTEYDIESALLHEVGHLLGFDDSADPAAAMAQTLARGDLRRELGADDLDAVCAVYPAGAATPRVGALNAEMQGGCSAGGPAGTTAAGLALLALAYLVTVTLLRPRGRSGSRSRDRAR
jgi:hypothetical protein